jgi:uncharacterized damage-inducible protein DinB
MQARMNSSNQLWFSRTFNFPYPADLLPNLFSRLRGTQARLEAAFRDVPAELRTLKPDGKWSAQEHAGHLLDLETLWRTRLDDFFSSSVQQLTPADLTNRATDEADFNARPIESIVATFRAARTALLDEAATRELASSERTLPHPRLKVPMRAIDHLYFVAEHDDHHLAEIERLLAAQK